MTGVVCTTFVLGCGGSGDSTGPGNNQSQGSDFHIRFRANGAQVEFNAPNNVLATIDKVGSQFHFSATGLASNGNSITVAVLDASAITTATYTGFQVVNSTGGFRHAQIRYTTGGAQYENTTSSSDNRITITEMTSTTIRGTFSGTVMSSGRPSLLVTNGEFVARRIN